MKRQEERTAAYCPHHNEAQSAAKDAQHQGLGLVSRQELWRAVVRLGGSA